MGNIINEAITNILGTYELILKVDLLNDSYVIIQDSNRELTGKIDSVFSSWLSSYVSTSNIHKDDIADIKCYFSLDGLKNRFDYTDGSMTLMFRRIEEGEFRWKSVEFVRDSVYDENNRIVFLYMKSLYDNQIAEIENYAELKRICNYDTLTNVQNNYAFIKQSKLYSALENSLPVGVVFGDVNGLKIVNDTKGHDMGNSLIKTFCDMLKRYFGASNVFRLSGDEFVALLINVTREELEESFEALYEELHRQPLAIGSIGWGWKENPRDIKEVVNIAEKKMYEDKADFYAANPDYRREYFEKNQFIEQQAVINFLADGYSTVGIADLCEDSYSMMKTDSRIKDATVGEKYSDYVNIFVNKLMDEESMDAVRSVTGIESLKKTLKDTEMASAKFHMKDGQWRQITFRKLTSDVDGTPQKVIFYASEVE